MSTAKKALETKDAIINADGKVATLGLSNYKNRNIQLTLEVDGKPYRELTVDIMHTLPLNCVVINKNDEPWIKRLILNNHLGTFYEKYYVDDIAYSIYSLYKSKLKEFCPDEYDDYIYSFAENAKKGINRAQLIDREHRYHWRAVQKSKKKPLAQKRKSDYRTSINSRSAQKRYYNKTERINAYLPKGMKSHIEQFGEKASVALKRKLMEYLDECEQKGEE